MKPKESWLFRVVPWVIGTVFVLMICYVIGLVIVVYFAAGEINTAIKDGTGIKGMVEQIWCGKDGCK